MGAILLAVACAAASVDEAYLQSIRDEHRALERAEALAGWYGGTQGRAVPVDALSLQQSALDAVARARRAATGEEGLALEFLQRALLRERVAAPLAALDAEYLEAETGATVRLPWRERPVAFRDMELVLAQEPDAARRRAAFRAMNAVRTAVLNPILLRREDAAQASVRAAGFADPAAFAEEERRVDLRALLADGAGYLRATDGVYAATLDRVSREELGLPRAELRRADWNRLWKAPRLARYFDPSLEVEALQAFLGGIGLELGAIRIDAEPRPLKRPRAFVVPVAAPLDVRLSVKPAGGLDDYWSLFHEAGHALHFASAQVAPAELLTDGYAAPGEAFGELFRLAFADPAWLRRYRDFLARHGQPVPDQAALAAMLRRTALAEMYFIRRYAFAKVAYELRLHGSPEAQIAPALALLPAPAEGLPQLYRQLFSLASGIRLDDDDAQLYRTDVDPDFLCADYARAFALAGLLHDAVRERFGPDWPADPRVGAFLRAQLFAPGASLTAEQVAQRLGANRLDFSSAAARAHRLVAEADALEQAQ